MKKVFFSAVVFAVLASSAFTRSSAQTSAKPAIEQAVAGVSLSKTVRSDNANAAVKINKGTVNGKVLSSFSRSFANATNDEWFALNKRVFAVYFDTEGRYARAAFTKNGYMLYCVSRASERNLSKEDRIAVKSNYVEYDITNVEEVTSVGKTVWIINLENAENVVIVRVADGAVDEMAKYKNGRVK